MAQWSKFIGAPSRNEFWEPQEESNACPARAIKYYVCWDADKTRVSFYLIPPNKHQRIFDYFLGHREKALLWFPKFITAWSAYEF